MRLIERGRLDFVRRARHSLFAAMVVVLARKLTVHEHEFDNLRLVRGVKGRLQFRLGGMRQAAFLPGGVVLENLERIHNRGQRNRGVTVAVLLKHGGIHQHDHREGMLIDIGGRGRVGELFWHHDYSRL